MIRVNSISLSRQLWLGAIATLALGFFALAPNTLAANTASFSPTPAAQYELYKGDDYNVTVKVGDVSLNNNLTFSVAKVQPVMLFTQLDTYNYQPNFNTTKTFSWDGKLAGNYVSAGTYRIQVKATNANDEMTTLTKDVEVTEEARIYPMSPAITWNKDSGVDYKIDYELSTVLPACLFFSVDGEVVDTAGPFNTSDGKLTWDGKINGVMVANGSHAWKIDIDSSTQCAGQAKVANAASGNVNVTNTIVIDTVVNPSISNSGVSVNPFSPNADGNKDSTTVSFKISEDAKVTVTVENSKNVVVRTLMNAVSKSAGTVETVWNGKDTGGSVVPNGNYKIVILADNDANGNSTAGISVTVDDSTVVTPTENCAGFTDLAKNYAKCDVVTFVKEAGIMTGNADKTFDPNDYLQRDEVAAVSLRTFGLFNESKDYCGGSNPFSDVSIVSDWAAQHICRGVSLGMITGYKSGVDAGKFKSARATSRIELLALILRNVDDTMPTNEKASYLDTEINQWYSGFAKYSKDKGLFSGNYLQPTDYVTRIEAAEVLYKLDQLGKI